MSRIRINISDVFNLNGAVIYNPDDYKPVTKISIDSRRVRKNTLFVAVKGERFDGHKFIPEALEHGATSVLVDKRYYKKPDQINVPIITVPDTVKAFGELANIWRNKLNAKIISITGSNGKTGTKDIVAELLSSKYKVVKTSPKTSKDFLNTLILLTTVNADLTDAGFELYVSSIKVILS